jgi:hypothetical protein
MQLMSQIKNKVALVKWLKYQTQWSYGKDESVSERVEFGGISKILDDY